MAKKPARQAIVLCYRFSCGFTTAPAHYTRVGEYISFLCYVVRSIFLCCLLKVLQAIAIFKLAYTFVVISRVNVGETRLTAFTVH